MSFEFLYATVILATFNSKTLVMEFLGIKNNQTKNLGGQRNSHIQWNPPIVNDYIKTDAD